MSDFINVTYKRISGIIYRSCNECETDYLSPKEFANHIKERHAMVYCEICDTKYENEIMLEEHMVEKHNIKEDPYINRLINCPYCNIPLGNNTLEEHLKIGLCLKNPQTEQIENIGGLTASKKHRYSLIPLSALNSLAMRFELGQQKHGPQAFNGLQQEQINKEWVKARLEHTIHHCYLALQQIEGKHDPLEEDLNAQAGAIMFGGSVLAVWANKVKNAGETK